MARTTIRSKSKPKKKQDEQKLGIKILVEDLRVGDRLVTSWHARSDLEEGPLDDKEDLATRYVNRSIEVKNFEECAGAWRTHVHVNKSMCYDMRTYVWIVKG